MLEVVRGELAIDLLKKASSEYGLFPDSELICMDLFLSFGDISGLKSINNRDVIGEIVETKKQIINLLKLAIRHKEVRIWTSTATTEDYLNMLFVLDLLTFENAEFDIRIIDSVNMPVSNKYPDTPAWELGCLESESVKKLLTFEEKITDEKAKRLLQDWGKIVSENSPLRICKNGVIESVQDDYLDKIIIDVVKELGQVEKHRIIGCAMARCDHSDGNLCDQFFAYRLEKLVAVNETK